MVIGMPRPLRIEYSGAIYRVMSCGNQRQIRRGWRLGDDQFRKEPLAVGKSAGGSHYGSEHQERDQEKANRLVDEELRRLGWTEKELEQRPKGDRQKVETARMLRRQTTMVGPKLPALRARSLV